MRKALRNLWCALRGHPYAWSIAFERPDDLADIAKPAICVNCCRVVRLGGKPFTLKDFSSSKTPLRRGEL